MIEEIVFIFIQKELALLLVLLLHDLWILWFGWKLETTLRQWLSKFTLVVVTHATLLLNHRALSIVVDCSGHLLNLLGKQFALIVLQSGRLSSLLRLNIWLGCLRSMKFIYISPQLLSILVKLLWDSFKSLKLNSIRVTVHLVGLGLTSFLL